MACSSRDALENVVSGLSPMQRTSLRCLVRLDSLVLAQCNPVNLLGSTAHISTLHMMIGACAAALGSV